MTTNWKRKNDAECAGAEALRGSVVAPFRHSRSRSLLRWKRAVVCGDAAANTAWSEPDDLSGAEDGADSTGSSLTRTIFYSSRIQTQPTTRKETHNQTQEKERQTNHKTSINSQETRNLSLTTKEKKLWQNLQLL